MSRSGKMITRTDVLNSGFRHREDNDNQEHVPIIDRLSSIKKNVETVEEVLNDIQELQIKGKNLVKPKDDKIDSEIETSGQTNFKNPRYSNNTESHSKLDVEELVEIDRGLQYVQWLQVIQEISNKVRLVYPI